MENPRSLSNRIDVLEQQLLQVRHMQYNPVARAGNVMPPLQVRLVKTVSDSGGGSYPSAGADTFGIIFVDGTYTKSAGTNAHTFTLRKSTPAVDVAHSINARYYPVNTYALVFRQNHRWWFVEETSKARWIDFTVTTSAFTTATASLASQTVNDFWQGGDPGSTVTIYNKASASNYIFHGPVGAKGRACLDDIDDKYRIVTLEGYATFVYGTLSGALTTTGTLTVSSYWNGLSPGSSVTVQNLGSVFTGAGGEKAQATYDPVSNNYVLTWVEC